MTLFDDVGGQPFFDALAARFYAGVATDPLLRPLYPDDLTDPTRWLGLFLGQYWGGATTYSDERGHPRLRMRHGPFDIGEAERDRWLHHMLAAIEAAHDLDDDSAGHLVAYVTTAADAMVNRPPDGGGPRRRGTDRTTVRRGRSDQGRMSCTPATTEPPNWDLSHPRADRATKLGSQSPPGD